MKLCCCDEKVANETTEASRAVVEDDTKTPRLVKPDANYESAAMNFAQETEVWNRHKDEDMNAQENANMNDLLTSEEIVHVMKHAEWGISGATITRQLQDCGENVEEKKNPQSLPRSVRITQFSPHRGAEFEARGKCVDSVVFPFVVVLSIPRLVPFVAHSQYTLTRTRQLEQELSHRRTTR